MNALEEYVSDLAALLHSNAGVKETSGYPALHRLLSEVGKGLKPKVKPVIHLKNTGAGIPDGGLFTEEQLKPLGDHPDTALTQLPARAAIEVKPLSQDLDALAREAQVAGYAAKYGIVLITNYREFRIVRGRPNGAVESLESYSLAASERDFRTLAANPRKAAHEHGARLADFLQRAMLMRSPINTPKDLAWFLASYAREALARVERAEVPALEGVRAALEEALGLEFAGKEGEHFFRSTLVQTLFYGIFSAWVLWQEQEATPGVKFDYRFSQYFLRLPVLNALFEQVADYSKVEKLGIIEVLKWAEDALNRVDTVSFFSAFDSGHAVQYFYEPFLAAFDPALRKQMGVWYTPPEIVKYMVARVDHVLRSELGIEDGLADPSVVVLDPCAGTGAYLVEVLRSIAETLRNNGAGKLLGHEVAKAAHERVFGFEILPASYVVAHLQLGLLLRDLGATSAAMPRPGMFLTNALTGWGHTNATHKQLAALPELLAERDAAEKVKSERQILVVLGNPPYNAFAGVSPQQEQGLVEPYKAGLVKKWKIKKFNLDDLYVRFFRLAERRIAANRNGGVVCYISNASYLNDPSFVVMRERLLNEFDVLWFDNMNGDSRETGKLTPDGKPDPSVFSTDFNREGIRVGTAIGLLVRRPTREAAASVRYNEYWGVGKRADLLKSLADPDAMAHYQAATPTEANRYSFRPAQHGTEYAEWPTFKSLCGEVLSNGLMEKRAGALLAFDRSAIRDRMSNYFDPSVDWEELAHLHPGLGAEAARFDAKKARTKVTGSESYSERRVRRYALRPFDTRWCYYSPIRPLWNEPRPVLWIQAWPHNWFLMTRPAAAADPEGSPFSFTRLLGDNDYLRGHAYYAPVRAFTQTAELGAAEDGSPVIPPHANLSQAALEFLSTLGLAESAADEAAGELLWYHVLAIGYSPAYLSENADGIRMDWPRIPLPNDRDQLLASAALGRKLAALLDTEAPVSGVTSGAIRPELRAIAVLEGSSPPNFAITAGWGSAGKEGVTMPGKGTRSERAPTGDELVAGLGETTHDVYLNNDTYWRNVPDRVWNYYIGGYQVIKKWLSYREAKLLGRAISADEAREVQQMARRLAAIVLLEPELDANYLAVKSNTYAWPQPESRTPAPFG